MIEITPIEIKPDAVYQGKVYTQSIIAKLPDGIVVRIEDPSRDISKSDIDSNVTLEIRGLSVQSLSPNSIKKKGVEFSEEAAVSVCGRVDDVVPDKEFQLSIDVGYGQLWVGLRDSFVENVEMGDWVKIPGVRLQLG